MTTGLLVPGVLPPSVVEELERVGGFARGAPEPPTRPPRGVTYAPERARIADLIDHTLLKPEATAREVERLCAEAREHRFATVCVNPVWVSRCRASLDGTGVKVATVVGFPLGANATVIKVAEAERAIADGADELDVVAPIGAMKGGDWAAVARDIEAVVVAAAGRLVKVIIESALLEPVEIIRASAAVRDAGAQYVKTSTGFHSAGGATPEAVALMRLTVGDALGVKASGGIRDCATALRMIAAGATRIGTSAGVAMAGCVGPGPRPLRDLVASAGGAFLPGDAPSRRGGPGEPHRASL
jgi:deoxyribose-phosphate aldolase